MTEKAVLARLTRHPAPDLPNSFASVWQCIEFGLSKTSISDSVLPESWAATNGRYVHELFLRVRERFADAPVVICNPAFDCNRLELLKLVSQLALHDFQLASTTIFSTRKGIPIAYFFPTGAKIDFALSFLSTLDADLDGQLLSSIYARPVEHVTLQWKRAPNEWMRLHTCQVGDVYKQITKMAAQAISVNPKATVLGFNPHHAGDVLFACLAAAGTNHHLDGLIVNEAYVDIAVDCATQLELSVLKGGCPYRNGWIISDEAYFLHVVSLLPKNCLPLYMRANGDYNSTYFHLIDHFAFAMGASPRHPNQLLWDRLPTRSRDTADEFSGKKILLHFDAGWPLKIYPTQSQNELIEILYQSGNHITVLGKRNFDHGRYKEVAFEGYPSLLQLLSTQDAMVGMDSFPVHLAVHRLGIPSITLFGPTRPANSNARHGTTYVSLERGLACRPCYAQSVCGRDGGSVCANFAPSLVVYQALDAVLRGQEPQGQHGPREVAELADETHLKTNQFQLGLRTSLMREYLRPENLFRGASIVELTRALLASLRYEPPRMTWFKIKRFIRRRLGIYR